MSSAAGSVQTRLEAKLRAAFAPEHIEVANESGNHNVPPGSETHFRVVIVSPRFEGQRLLGRHRAVNDALRAELAGGVHALALHTYTLAEWRTRSSASPASPPCRGGTGR